MPDEPEVTQVTPVEGSADAGGGTEGAESAARSTSEYLTREALDEVMSGFAGQYQGGLEEMRGQLNQMAQALTRIYQGRGQQTQTNKPQIPDYPEFAEMDVHGFQKLLKSMNDDQTKRWETMQRRMEMMEQDRRMERDAEKYFNYLRSQTETAISKFPVFQEDWAKELLANTISVQANNVRGNLHNLNVMKIAQGLAGNLEKFRAAQAAAAAAESGQPGGTGIVPAGGGGSGAPPKGTPSRPGQKPMPEIKSERDIDKVFDQFLTPIAQGLFEDMGGGE